MCLSAISFFALLGIFEKEVRDGRPDQRREERNKECLRILAVHLFLEIVDSPAIFSASRRRGCSSTVLYFGEKASRYPYCIALCLDHTFSRCITLFPNLSHSCQMYNTIFPNVSHHILKRTTLFPNASHYTPTRHTVPKRITPSETHHTIFPSVSHPSQMYHAVSKAQSFHSTLFSKASLCFHITSVPLPKFS